jgi:thiol-disulfide isomerase/thioredoxin
MNRLIITGILLSLANSLWAQKAKINITILNGISPKYSWYVYDLPSKYESKDQDYKVDQVTNIRTSTLAFDLTTPKTVTVEYSSSKDKNRYAEYSFFILPGDNINFKADLQKPENGIEITGKGIANNYPLKIQDKSNQNLYGDTLPNRVIAVVNNQYQINKQSLSDYVVKYKPDALFIKTKTYDIQYLASLSYYRFKENNKYRIEQIYSRTQPEWERIQDSLFKTTKYKLITTKVSKGKTNALNQPIGTLNNNDALVSNRYKELIKNFMLREKERLWNQSAKAPKRFFKDWYSADVNTGSKLFQDDSENLLKEKIINTYFTGASADFLYASLIQEALDESNPKNIVTIFDRYKKQYQKSIYIKDFQADINKIRQRESAQLNDKMIFVTANGSKLTKLDEVLTLTKGKTVLVDMWGTWCGPCREEIEKNSAAIKAHFKDKGLDYLYVANFDSKNEQSWKKLISYFHLEGTHILANDELNKDIMTKVKGDGYPTYFIIKKDSSYELSNAGYPMNRDVLIKQLEKAIAE